MRVSKKSVRQNHPLGATAVWAMLSLPIVVASGCSGAELLTEGGASAPTPPVSAWTERPAELVPPPGFVPAPSGGTVMVNSKKDLAIVSDAISSQIHVVDLNTKQVIQHVALRPSDDPGQCVEGSSSGEFFCVLRTGSAVVRFQANPTQKEPAQRAFVCNEPRGLVFAKTTESLAVACEGGEVVTMATAAGQLKRQAQMTVEPGLHDVLLMDGESGEPESELWLSRKRRAKVIRVQWSSGAILSAEEMTSDLPSVVPTTAARLVRDPDGKGARILHSLGSMQLLSGWGGCVGCDPTLRAIDRKGRMIPKGFPLIGISARGEKERLSVPLDAAMRDANSIAVIAAGNRPYVADPSDTRSAVWLGDRTTLNQPVKLPPTAMPVAVAASGTAYVVQTIGRASLWIVNVKLKMNEDDQNDPEEIVLDPKPQPIRGLELFYASSQSLGMACASCHPDGQDDGHRWKLNVSGEGNIDGRTMPLQGTLSGRGKFRRTGHYDSLQKLVDSDLNALSAGRKITDSAKLTSWLLSLRAPWTAASGTEEQRKAGEEMYNAQCASCHGIDKPLGKMTQLTPVRATLPLLVAPFLVDVKNRAPYLRDACASSLDELFNGDCSSGGKEHKVEGKTAADLRQREALKAYLNSR